MREMDAKGFLNAVLEQDESAMREYFHREACIKWHCTNERFTLDEYIRANCEYPGEWAGEIERVEVMENLTVMAVRVFPKDRSACFHAVSFIELRDGKIISMDEYWADDGNAPQWRKDMGIGKRIR